MYQLNGFKNKLQKQVSNIVDNSQSTNEKLVLRILLRTKNMMIHSKNKLPVTIVKESLDSECVHKINIVKENFKYSMVNYMY